jgi:hypothetical protein
MFTRSILIAFAYTILAAFAACTSSSDPQLDSFESALDGGEPECTANGGIWVEGIGCFTGACEASCAAAGSTCGSVPQLGSPGTQCCCVGSCPGQAGACAACVNDGGTWSGGGPGLCAITEEPGPIVRDL